MPTIRIIASLLLLTLCCTANAQVYQWKDKNGRTILSDTPPPSSIRSRVLDTPAPAPAGTAAPAKSLADKNAEFKQRQQEAANKAEQDAKENSALEERKTYCEDAKRQLAMLKSGERVFTREVSGERSYMDDTQRNQQIAVTQRYLDDNCKGL